MKALTYTAPGRFELIVKPKPEVLNLLLSAKL